MDIIETMTLFFGWCSVLNIGILTITTILLIVFKNPISNIHSKMFGISNTDVVTEYFKYLGNYKIAIIVFNIAPYISLRIMMTPG